MQKKTRASVHANITVWPYTYKDEPCWVAITRKLDKEQPPDPKFPKVLMGLKIISIATGIELELSPEDERHIMMLILWHEGRTQVEEIAELEPALPKARWDHILNE